MEKTSNGCFDFWRVLVDDSCFKPGTGPQLYAQQATLQ